jgi:hypothetical protein
MTMTFSVLAGIAGTWSGVGHAEFPTISPLDYREELVLSSNDKDPVIHFEQRTWVKSGDAKDGEPLFWESGFIIERGNGIFELIVAQKGGRMEILKGGTEHGEKGSIVLHLKSTTILNDPRMIRSERRIVWSGETLTYELLMSTTANTKTARHLAARLLRNSK